MTALMTSEQQVAARLVLDEVLAERRRQHEKWGEQNHPDGTGQEFVGYGEPVALVILQAREVSGGLMDSASAREVVERAATAGTLTYSAILLEEALEALEESDPAKLRAELVQLAAVAVQWIEALDRRQG